MVKNKNFFKIKNSSILKLLQATPSNAPESAEGGEIDSEQHITGKIRKKGKCHSFTGTKREKVWELIVALDPILWGYGSFLKLRYT